MTGTWGGRGGNFASRPSKSVQRKGQLKMSAEPIVADEIYCVGTVCRSRKSIITAADEDKSRLCKIVGVVLKDWWRRPDVPEYKVRMLAFPITAIRRASELQTVGPQAVQ